LRTGRQAEHRRDYLAARAGAPERGLVYPRADLRGQRGRLPAQWLLAAASELEGRTLYSAALDPPPSRPWLTVVPSFEGALAGDAEPGSEQEYTLRSMLGWRRGGRNVLDHHVVAAIPRLHDGIGAEIARAGSDLTRWDGRLAPNAAPVPSAERPVSPTALQHWAACPFRYLLGHVLHVAETEKPEDTLTLTPIERGNLVHRALETFISEMPGRTSPGQRWSGDERARLLQIGAQLCDDAVAAGITGRPLLWRLERARLLQALDGFLDDDEALRAGHGVVPADVELSFGMRDSEDAAVLVRLGGGRELAFRGRIDRVDRAPDGDRLLVLDYKTGTPDLDMYKKLHVQPVSGGKLLQLPVYALAAQQRYGDVPAEAYYWFVRPQQYERHGYAVEPAQLDEFGRALNVIVSGMENGLFPARPGKQSSGERFDNCGICPYDRLCSSDRARVWSRKRFVHDLRDYVELAED
ncbi:MAG: PD-(D/E)XK nuclease family protein, partial [Dehalococcoidia bacterium]